MSHTKEDIYQHIRNVLVEQFEIEADSVTHDALLQEDLDIDSIDAVDLMIELKTLTGKKIALEDFREVKSISDVVDAVSRVIEENKQAAK